MKYDLKRHNCFWVYQNQTFFEESNGGFLWSPKTHNLSSPQESKFDTQ